MGAAAGDVGQRKGTLTVPRGAPARAVSRGGPALSPGTPAARAPSAWGGRSARSSSCSRP